MTLTELEVTAFRGLPHATIPCHPLTVLHGPMGSGKTSRLLAILYALTGTAPPGLTLDDLIHVDADAMWVHASLHTPEGPATIERRKRRGSASTLKTTGAPLPTYPDRVYIEGRTIADLFTGGPREKTLKLDALLGLADYTARADALTLAPIDRRLTELNEHRLRLQQAREAATDLTRTQDDVQYLDRRLTELQSQRAALEPQLNPARQRLQQAEEARRRLGDLDSKRRFLETQRAALRTLPPIPPGLDEEVHEVRARFDAAQRRNIFLMAVLDTLHLTGKPVDELTQCPLCSKPIEPQTLAAFHHYRSELQEVQTEASSLQRLLQVQEGRLRDAQRLREQAQFLEQQIAALEAELAHDTPHPLPDSDVQQATALVQRAAELDGELRELAIRRDGLAGQVKAYQTALTDVQRVSLEVLDAQITRLQALRSRVERIKTALQEAVAEARATALADVRSRFQDAFRRLYPYERLQAVDFEWVSMRGREVLRVKARVDGQWLAAPQLSTGETVAVSLALLVAIDQLERSPLLLLDEPEEGLDDEGVRGLATVLRHLATTTQVVVATRSRLLAELLPPVEVRAA